MICNISSGDEFNFLTAIKITEKRYGQTCWLFECRCGNIKSIPKYKVINNHIVSCGCYHKKRLLEVNTKHNKSRSRLYRIWADMKRRCKKHKDYYGRGISVCDEWNVFENFYSWSIDTKYSDKLTIERINVNGNYEPNNCTWIPKGEQALNTRNNINFIVNKKTVCLAKLAEILGVKSNKLYYIYYYKYKKDLYSFIDYIKTNYNITIR